MISKRGSKWTIPDAGCSRYLRRAVNIQTAEWVKVESDTSVPVQVEGEMLDALPIEITLHPQRLKLIFPMV
jgi:diacylglycerol kinase family enzyme